LNSLERSLQAGLSCSLIILLFLLWWTLTLTSRSLIESHLFAGLEQQAASVYELMPDTSSAPSQAMLDALAASRPQHHFRWVNEHLSISAGALNADSVTIPQLVPGQSERRRFKGPSGQLVLGWFGGIAINQHTGVFGVLQDVSAVNRKLTIFQWFAAVLSIVILLTMLVVQRVIVRRSVAKLEGIRRDMLKLEHGQAVALAEDVPAEIRPLVVEFNQLLRRFEQRLRQSRNAVGNLAHSLKGPLNLLIRYSESEIIDDQQRQDIAHNANHIGRLIESELKRARMAGRGAVGVRFDIDAELPAMIGLLQQVYSEKKVRVKYEVDDDVQLVHDRQDMLELIGNLLDNAVKWCDSLVLLRIRSADGVVIEVDDDGPGCSPELLSQLTGRGVRLDESVSGHGLGLSIVKDIVDTYRGSLQLERSASLNGLHVSVYLPVTQR